MHAFGPDRMLEVWGRDCVSAAVLNLRNADESHLLRFTSGKENDPNLAIFWKAGDSLRILTANPYAEFMRITDDCKLGIGTKIPVKKLTVVGGSKITGSLEILKAYGESSIFIESNAGMNDAGGNENLFIGVNVWRKTVSEKNNTTIGFNALVMNTDCSELLAIGDSSLYHNREGASDSLHAIENTAFLIIEISRILEIHLQDSRHFLIMSKVKLPIQNSIVNEVEAVDHVRQ